MHIDVKLCGPFWHYVFPERGKSLLVVEEERGAEGRVDRRGGAAGGGGAEADGHVVADGDQGGLEERVGDVCVERGLAIVGVPCRVN